MTKTRGLTTAACAVMVLCACSRERGQPRTEAKPAPALPGDAGSQSAEPADAIGAAVEAAVPAELAAAQAAMLDGFRATSDRPVRVNGAVIAHMIEAVRGDETMIAWVDAEYGSGWSVPHGRRIGISGAIDLYVSGPIPGGFHHGDVSTGGMKHPLLVVRVETIEDVSGHEELSRSRRATGKRVTETVRLIDPGTLGTVFQRDVSLRTGDGFGGSDLRGLAIEARGTTVRMSGTRQDRLPARRARCRQPPPEPVEFEWTGTGFIERAATDGPQRPIRKGGC